MTVQNLILALHRFWAARRCLICQPYDLEKGAGTFNPATFLRVLGPEPWRAAYVEPCRRPADGRYGDNPNRLQHYYQYQVVIKPCVDEIQAWYLESLATLGVDPRTHDIRFVEDDWESPTLGAWGCGWEVQLDGMEITQFTYFQEAGGHPLDPVTVELTYGIERLAMYVQGVDSVFDVRWSDEVTYGELFHDAEVQFSKYNFESADVAMIRSMFAAREDECRALLAGGLALPAYDACMRTSHLFNVLDARGALSVAERTGYIGRVRGLARGCADAYVEHRRQLGFPLLRGNDAAAGAAGGKAVTTASSTKRSHRRARG